MIWRFGHSCVAFIAAAATANAPPPRSSSRSVISRRRAKATRTFFSIAKTERLLRQLTKDDSGQDLDPIFAPDGETIVFTREIGENKFEFWSVRAEWRRR